MDIEKANNIKEAIKLLKEEGYITIKISESMKKDIDKCEASGYQGDCAGCSCSVCVIQ